ncbi:MAG: LysR family transcriptional regulator [Rhodospirillaceae bacterium]|jgi:LysR family transcriptional regulator, nitrogen assimilation regulatory protein|nr:LysR family transcriptional regulator [Rhodospirillaceae bacterium]
MKIRQLRYFVEVARVQSINRAAENLHIAQPALSRHIRQLEEDLNVKLFLRESHGTKLTEAGKEFLKDSTDLLENFEKVRANHTKLDTPIEGRVIVAMPYFVAKLLALPLVYKIEQETPGINLHIIEDTQNTFEYEQLEHLKNGKYDLVISYEDGKNDTISSTYMANELFFLISNSGFDKEPDNEKILSKALQNNAVYIPPYHSKIQRFLMNASKDVGIEIDLTEDFDSWDMIKCQIKTGAGYTIAPLALAVAETETNELVGTRIVQPEFSRKIHLLSRSGDSDTAAVVEVFNTIQTLTKDIVKRGLWE